MTLKIDSTDRPLEPAGPAMRAGRWCLPASLGAHAAVLALVVGLVGEVQQLKGENEVPVDVDIITVNEMTSADSAPSADAGEDGGIEAAEPKPVEVAEPKPVEMAELDPLEEMEPLALEAARAPEATELEATDAPEEEAGTESEPESQEQAKEAEPVPAAEAEEPKEMLPVLATHNEMEESVSAAEEFVGEDVESAVPTERESEDAPAAKAAELMPKVEPRELEPLPEKAETQEKREPEKKNPAKKKRERKEKKEVRAVKTAGKVRPGKTTRKTEAALASGRNAEASVGKQRRSSGSSSLSNYLGQITARLQRQKRYPEEAKRKGARGTVRISFTINGSGHVTGSRLVGSSGEASLDKEVRAMLARAAPFPPIPEGMGRSSLSLTVPISFSMR